MSYIKTKVSAKEVNEHFPFVVRISYCEAQILLSALRPDYYTAGKYGWSADVYAINNRIAIVTGYGPFGNIKPSYDLINKYEKEAEKLRGELSYDDYCKASKELIVKMLNELLIDCRISTDTIIL